ncbi:MAG: 50S ribosomal protein L10 [Nanoarchaeota archaeon]|nr:50S ribosomal protein L10 [Nanoarchaeota archaeon]
MNSPKAIISEKKSQEVKKIKEFMQSSKILGIVDMENLPAAQLLKMRLQLKKKVVIRMCKRRLINIAIDQLKDKIKGITKLKEYIKGMPALIFTEENPFKLYKVLQKNKSTAPAKPGQKAPNDIEIKAGPTQFAPGPIISELGSVGLKTAIENGKVAIKADKVIVKEGEVIDAKSAALLQRLGIEPMEVGLNLIAVLENGTIFAKDILAIDEKEYINNIKHLNMEAFNLAMHINYLCDATIKHFIIKAYRDAKALVDSQDIVTKDNIKDILAKAERQMQTLKSKTE